ncbi:MAG: hypothetical protein ABSA76_09045 [Bacteroidales bacterium]
MFKKRSILIFLLLIISQSIISQATKNEIFRIITRYSFYSYEKSGELLLHVPDNLIHSNISVIVTINGELTGSWKGVPGKKIIRIPIILNLKPSHYRLAADISASGKSYRYQAEADLLVLDYKPNEVKTDRLTGGLIVNKRQFFPFGFYCYSPVYPTLPEDEAVRGFNLISPYQKIMPETIKERKAYMDRCAELGMKVNYNLLSVSGGGGVNSKIDGLTDSRKRELLINEINTFKDHPALLAWYISDEPNGNNIPPDSLIKIYKLIKEIDPWHPVSVVFMAPFLASVKYADAMDIIMADPYPVPDLPVTVVGNVAGQLANAFVGQKPVWIVPQAFGGGEIWRREPTLQEIRSMTYQAIINGSRGIQYFVRHGLNLFPKSTGTWSECGRMAVEIAELAPWLLSDEESIPVSSGSPDVIAKSYVHEGRLLILGVNRTNAPVRVSFSISRSLRGKAKVIFENRLLAMNGGSFSDVLSSYGSQAYIVDLKPVKESVKPWTRNLIIDPGFEDTSSPGIPASCYARGNGERGATYFLDSREHIEGYHSLRLITPTDNGSAKLRFFPVTVRNGARYMISVFAKTDKEQGLNINMSKPHYFNISLGDFGTARFKLEGEWKQYVTFVTIPYFTDLTPKTNVILQMPSAGVGWFDLLQVAECADIGKCNNPELNLPGIKY